MTFSDTSRYYSNVVQIVERTFCLPHTLIHTHALTHTRYSSETKLNEETQRALHIVVRLSRPSIHAFVSKFTKMDNRKRMDSVFLFTFSFFSINAENASKRTNRSIIHHSFFFIVVVHNSLYLSHNFHKIIWPCSAKQI